MAKKRKKRGIKKQTKTFISIFSFFAFFVLIFLLFKIGTSLLLPHHEDLPPNTLEKEAVALGIDVSEWQGEIDWQRVKEDGYSFAIIRSSFGLEETIDSSFFENVEGAKDAGIKVGAYHYSHATTVEEAIEEADFFISLLDYYYWDYPVYYDIETDRQDHLSQQELTDITLAFLEKVKDAGYTAGVYASEYWLEHRLDMSQLEDYEVWIASYTSELDYEGKYDIWQYTKDGHVNGISGNMDINVAYKKY